MFVMLQFDRAVLFFVEVSLLFLLYLCCFVFVRSVSACLSALEPPSLSPSGILLVLWGKPRVLVIHSAVWTPFGSKNRKIYCKNGPSPWEI